MANQQESEKCGGDDQESVSFQGLELAVVPSSLFSMENVRRVDLSSNELTRFPGARVGQELPFLQVLVLSNNLLHVLEDILALAAAPRLCELDVRDNPLRLRHNRLYLLETVLFHEASVDEDTLRELHRDEDVKNFVSTSQPPRNILYRSRLPRRRGFPMLQMLNGDWITDSETRQVEVERGKVIEYFPGSKQSKVGARRVTRKASSVDGIKVNERRFDGSRLTIKQMLRNEARITAIPPPQVLKHYQIDTESCEEVSESFVQDVISPGKNEEEDKEHQLLHQLFRPLTSLSADTPEQEQLEVPSIKPASGSSDTEPWNYPITTFDDLQSDERQYVRYKSKHAGGTLERDDHFFESTTFLDCVAQCERSRRLTIRAVDLLTHRHADASKLPNTLHSSTVQSQSSPTLPMSEAAATLTHNLSANFTKRQARESFERVTDFQQKQVTVGNCRTQAAVGDYLLGEHIALRQKTNQLLSQATGEIRWHDNAHGIEANLEESLSKVKLRNAVDLANTLGGGKEQKRLIQALIDADAKVIEEERVMEEHKSHRQRLRRINARQVVHPHTRHDVDLAKKLARLHAESPWQERNWRAKMKLLERKREEIDLTVPSSVHSVASSGRMKVPHSRTEANSTTAKSSKDTPPQVVAKFRTIETVEKAAQDPLVQVNSHDLLVRCSEIRQNKDKHVKALAIHRDRFLDDESEWQQMRQDPINVVRRHLRRELYQDVQQIQVGTMDYFYSPIFQ